MIRICCTYTIAYNCPKPNCQSYWAFTLRKPRINITLTSKELSVVKKSTLLLEVLFQPKDPSTKNDFSNFGRFFQARTTMWSETPGVHVLETLNSNFFLSIK